MTNDENLESEQTSTKGRATRSRKEAEAARKQALRVPKDKKAARAAMRSREAEARVEMRRAFYTGDEKHLPLRDKGPVRRFVRNYIDSRLGVGDLFVPLAFLILIPLLNPSPEIQSVASMFWTFMLLMLAVDAAFITIRLRKLLKAQFPNEVHRGAISYALLRSIQMRFTRIPKPLVKIGGAPRENKIPKSLQ
jgi:hypothetical protein